MNKVKYMSVNSLCVFLALSLAAPQTYASSVGAGKQEQASSKSDDTKKARIRFERGVELYESGDVEAAYIEFKRAYALVPNYHLLFNIAQAQAELKDYVGALESLSQYLEDGGKKISTARRIAVHKEIKRLKTYLAIVTLKISADGAQVKVDGKIVDLDMHRGEVAVSAGRRKVEVLHPDYLPWERYIDVAGEDNLDLEVDLVARPKDSKALVIAPNPSQSAVPQKRRLGPMFWSGVAATAVFGVGTAVVGGLALGAQSKHDKLLKTFPTSESEIQDSAKGVKNLALVTDIGLIVTTGAAAFTVASFFWGRKKKRKQEAIKTAVSPGGFWVQGRF